MDKMGEAMDEHEEARRYFYDQAELLRAQGYSLVSTFTAMVEAACDMERNEKQNETHEDAAGFLVGASKRLTGEK